MDSLITVDDLAGYLQRDLDRYSAELAVQGASGVIRSFCGWDITRTAETMNVDWLGGNIITLPTLRLNDVTRVTIDGTDLAIDDYAWAANGVIVVRPARCLGLYRAETDVDHGYTPVPDEIRIVCCSTAARMYANPEGLFSRTTGDSTRAYGKTISDLEMRLISRYVLT